MNRSEEAFRVPRTPPRILFSGQATCSSAPITIVEPLERHDKCLPTNCQSVKNTVEVFQGTDARLKFQIDGHLVSSIIPHDERVPFN